MSRGRKPGTPKTGGRAPGTPNKPKILVRDVLTATFLRTGGVKAMVEWAMEGKNRTEFYKLWAKYCSELSDGTSPVVSLGALGNGITQEQAQRLQQGVDDQVRDLLREISEEDCIPESAWKDDGPFN